jgi:hypothetical protein
MEEAGSYVLPCDSPLILLLAARAGTRIIRKQHNLLGEHIQVFNIQVSRLLKAIIINNNIIITY